MFARLLIFLSVFFPLVAHQGPLQSDELFARGPYVQSVTQTSAVVIWEAAQGAPAELRYGASAALAQRARMEQAQANNGRTLYRATLSGLTPDQQYFYQLWRADTPLAAPRSFVTPPTRGAFRFAVAGDSRGSSEGARKVAAALTATKPAFVLHMGDLTTHGTAAEMDADVFGVYRGLMAGAPLYPTLGNHDLTHGPEPYLSAFVLPRNGPAGLEERAYSFDWGDAHFVSLDAYSPYAPGSAQYEWLEADLLGSRKQWKFVYLHIPLYSAGGHGGDETLRAALAPLFEQAGVDAVFAGHDHHYERTVPIAGNQTAEAGQPAVIYYVVGGGGAPLYPAGRGWWTAASASRYSFVSVDVRGCRLTLTALDEKGVAFDDATLDKCPLTWTQVNQPGFGEHAEPYTGQEAFDLTVFKDQLYLGMEGKACARIWRTKPGIITPTGQQDWEQVVSNGFDGTTDCAVTPATTDNDHIDSLEPFGGYLYASTAMQTSGKRGTQVWRSASGAAGTWEQVNRPGFGNAANENFKDMVVFQGLLCGGTGNGAGAEVWCADGVTPNPTDPARLMWRQRNVDGFGDHNNIKIWSSDVYDGALYFGVESATGAGSIWRTRDINNPSAWERVFSPDTHGIDPETSRLIRRVDVLAHLDSGSGAGIYIGFAIPGGGSQVWRSRTGNAGAWEPVVKDGFGSRTSGRFISDAATVFDGRLYVATLDEAKGAAIWRTTDGAVWEQAAPSGFGSNATFAAELAPFAGRLYAWTSNYTEGQGVWRGEPNGN
jgi:hypothetical protein